jgi:hypothetical protein
VCSQRDERLGHAIRAGVAVQLGCFAVHVRVCVCRGVFLREDLAALRPPSLRQAPQHHHHHH